MSPGPLDAFAPGTAETAALLLCRVGGLVLLAPMFSGRTVPMPVRTGIVLALTAVLLPAALAVPTAAVALSPAAALGETIVGFSIGLGAALLVGAAETAGDLVGQSIGLAGASLMDPLGGHPSSALGQVYALLAGTLLLVANGHLVMLDALGESLRRVPVGAATEIPAALTLLVRQGGILFALGLQVAAPVIAAGLIANAGLGVLARAVPQLNLMNVAFPVQIGIGLVAIAASLPFLALVSHGWGETVRESARLTFDALLRRGP